MADDRQLSAAFALLCWHFCEQTGSICFAGVDLVTKLTRL